MNDITIYGVINGDTLQATDTGLIASDSLTFEEWANYGKGLSKRYSRIQWQIGDWLNIGERHFGESYAQVLDDLHFSYGTLRNYASICARIPAHVRNPKLLFHQTKHVAPLTEVEQAKIIQFAVDKQLPGDEIKAIVDKVLNKPAHETIEGIVKEIIPSDFAVFAVLQLSTNTKPSIGQVFTLRIKS